MTANTKASWVPTNKWMITQITALAGLATMYVTTGGWDMEESIALIALFSQAATSYLAPNSMTLGGVPRKDVSDAS